MIIDDMEKIGNRIYAHVCYELRYDMDTEEFTCTCDGFTYKKECTHIKQFRKDVEKFLKDEE